MKNDKKTELPGAPLVPDAKKVSQSKPTRAAAKQTSEMEEESPATDTDKQADQVSPETDESKDDEIAKASSDVLTDEETAEKPQPTKQKGKIRRFFRAWWDNKKARWATIVIVLLLIAGAAVYPTTRYFLLNTAGVRSRASVTVIDNASRQPLKNVEVQLNNATATTNDDGYAELSGVRLGDTTMVVQRRAFAPLEKNVTVGWGSNPLGEVILEPQGLQYSFVVTDFLSGEPLEKVEAISGDASAFSDKDGKIILTLDTTSDEPVNISMNIDGYRQEKLTETAESTTIKKVKMVPAQEQAFITKRSGKFDLYKIYADGRGETLVLSGTGQERDDIVLVPQPAGNNVALISTRSNQRGTDGNLLSELNIVNIGDKKVNKLDTSDRIQVVGWIDEILVYIVVGQQTQADGAKKQRLVSYNLENNQKLDITSATYFNDVVVAGDKVYYAPATEAKAEEVEGEAAQPNTSTDVGLYVSDAGGTNIKRLFGQEVWSMIRSGYDTITFSTGKDWHEYKLGAAQTSVIGGPPANQKPRVYTNNAGNTRSLWIDERDGKGVLLSYDLKSKEESVLAAQSGLSYPLRWLNDSTAVYRISNDQETADYVVSLNGGDPKKIIDVTNTAGIDRWYYY